MLIDDNDILGNGIKIGLKIQSDGVEEPEDNQEIEEDIPDEQFEAETDNSVDLEDEPAEVVAESIENIEDVEDEPEVEEESDENQENNSPLDEIEELEKQSKVSGIVESSDTENITDDSEENTEVTEEDELSGQTGEVREKTTSNDEDDDDSADETTPDKPVKVKKKHLELVGDLFSTNYLNVIEAILFASDETLDHKDIIDAIKATDGSQIKIVDEDIEAAVDLLNSRYAQLELSFSIIRISGGFAFATKPAFAKYLTFLDKERAKKRLSQSALETLSIIAYKQPITKAELEKIRGVNSDYIVSTLLEKRLITIVGRADAMGRPLLYGTTDEFLKYFGLNSLADLPKPREIDEIVQDPDFEEQKRKIMMTGLEEEDVIKDRQTEGADDGTD